MRIMAIDYGDARTGVAVSDPTGLLAGQTFLIKSRKAQVVLEELAALAKAQGAEELVMGYPRNMDGTLGPRAEKYAAFAKKLEAATGLPVILWDERRTPWTPTGFWGNRAPGPKTGKTRWTPWQLP